MHVAYVQETKGQLFKRTLAWVFNETAFYPIFTLPNAFILTPFVLKRFIKA